jgi:hypothetical protein
MREEFRNFFLCEYHNHVGASVKGTDSVGVGVKGADSGVNGESRNASYCLHSSIIIRYFLCCTYTATLRWIRTADLRIKGKSRLESDIKIGTEGKMLHLNCSGSRSSIESNALEMSEGIGVKGASIFENTCTQQLSI